MWALVLFAILVGVIAALLSLRWIRRGLFWIGWFLFVCVAFVCRQVSKLVDFVLAPRGVGRIISPWRYALWAIINLVLMATIVAVSSTYPDSGLLHASMGALSVILVLIQVLTLTAALIVSYEDYDVMDGVMPSSERRIGGEHSVKEPIFIGISTVLFVTSSMLSAYWFEKHGGVPLIAEGDIQLHEPLDYVIAILWSLPIDVALRPIARLIQERPPPTFVSSAPGNLFYFAVYLTGSFLLAGLISILIQQAWLLHRMTVQIGDAEGPQYQLLVQRGRHAPGVIKSGILRRALAPEDPARQRKFIKAAADIGIYTFPSGFCWNLRSYTLDVQIFGLQQVAKFVRKNRHRFDKTQTNSLIPKLIHHLWHKKTTPEVVKQLLWIIAELLADPNRRADANHRTNNLRAVIAHRLRQGEIRRDEELVRRLKELQLF
jgi:hypothetical protein